MSHKAMRGLIVLPVLLTGTLAFAADDILFNGKDLAGWVADSAPGAANPRKLEDTWSVRDGAIACAGGRNGGNMHYTPKSWTSFELSIDYRWGEIDPEILKRGGNIYNSGIFWRSNPRFDPGQVVPFYYQSQIIHTPARSAGETGGGTGDIWIVGYDHLSFKGARPSPPRAAPAPAPAPGAAAPAGQAAPLGRAGGGGFANRPLPAGFTAARSFPRLKFAEKAIGQWNHYVIRVDRDKVTYTLNGEVVNRATGAELVGGKIGLECENTPIFFRNIKVKPL